MQTKKLKMQTALTATKNLTKQRKPKKKRKLIWRRIKLKQRNNFKTNTTSNEIMDLVNDSKVKVKSLSRV